MLRTIRYLEGQGDVLPEDDEALEKVTANLETLLPMEPMLQRFIEPQTMAQTHFVVVTHTVGYEGYEQLDRLIRKKWDEAVKTDPALAAFDLRFSGVAQLQAKITHNLVPTLEESFILSIVIIYTAFLVVFRNGAARLMAMIPSLFAILVMFGAMRLFGLRLNPATILIASTVLGASENDQIHFFFHFLERRSTGTTEESLRHALHIAGRAILFATLINAGGFLAFALAQLPAIREFGMLSALAFVLSMLADFSALLAALWIVFRAVPDRVAAERAAAKAPEESPSGG
jgi:predicted RND superfamily exporter protein